MTTASEIETTQMMTLFPLPGLPERPRRRSLWRDEMRRLIQVVDDHRQRDQQRQAEATGHLRSQLADLRDRIVDLERTTNIADIATAPRRSGELRAFAR